MSEHDQHTLTGAYATDALPHDERQVFDAHLETCLACQQEVAELAATAARLGAAAAEPAPAAMRDRVLAEVARTRQVSPVVSGGHKRRPAQPFYRQPVGIAASFLLLLALGLGVFATAQHQRADRAEQLAARIAAVATDPNRAYVSHEVSSGGTGTVVVVGDQAIFRATDVTSLPGSHTYQLWIIDAKGAHSAGVLGTARNGNLAKFVQGVKPTDQIGLTVEPKGGSKAPTTQPVLLLPLHT